MRNDFNMVNALKEIYLRELGNLHKEMSSYLKEQDIWRLQGEINNTAGNLCLHACGNLLHYFGAVLGGTDYVRNRDAEFSQRNVPLTELLHLIDNTRDTLSNTFSNQLASLAPDAVFPVEFLKEKRSMAYVLIHLLSHLTYHIGQINYCRRMMS